MSVTISKSSRIQKYQSTDTVTLTRLDLTLLNDAILTIEDIERLLIRIRQRELEGVWRSANGIFY